MLGYGGAATNGVHTTSASRNVARDTKRAVTCCAHTAGASLRLLGNNMHFRIMAGSWTHMSGYNHHHSAVDINHQWMQGSLHAWG